MCKVLLAVSNKGLLLVGTTLNLLLLSVPLLFSDIKLDDYLFRPSTWTYYSLMALFCFTEGHLSLSLKIERTIKTSNLYLPYLSGICILFVFWISLYEYTKTYQFDLTQIITASLLSLLGISLRLVSIRKLKACFVSHVALINQHRLVTTGIYAIVRHPSELGLILICSGVAFLLGSMVGLWLVVLTILPLTIYRIWLEENILLDTFALKFNQYKATTPMLVPLPKFFLFR